MSSDLSITVEELLATLESNVVEDDGVRIWPCETGGQYIELQYSQVLDALTELTEKAQEVCKGFKKFSACELIINQILHRHARVCRGER